MKKRSLSLNKFVTQQFPIRTIRYCHMLKIHNDLCSIDDEVDDKPLENEKSTDDDEDSTCCNSTSDNESTAEEATSRSGKESDLAHIVLCENFVIELALGTMYDECHASN